MKRTIFFLCLISFLFSGFRLKAQVDMPPTAMTAAPGNPEEDIMNSLKMAFDTLKYRSIRPAEGYIKYDYLIPAGFYKQMWDWDGFFIGVYLASHDPKDSKYLKYWVLNFVNSADSEGYVPGCITTKGPRPIFGKFALKPFLSQGAYFASVYGQGFDWLKPVYDGLKKVLKYREKTQYDPKYGLFFWDLAIQSGADNNPALSNDTIDRGAILATDINTFQLREYISMMKIAERLKKPEDVIYYRSRADSLKSAMMRYLWFENDNSFFNIWRKDGSPVKRVSYSNFVPLIQKILTQEQAGRMIKRYLLSEKYMYAKFGIRSLSASDPDYNNKCIIIPYSNWQGPIWINANFLYTIALKNYHFDNEAANIGRYLAPMLLSDIQTCGSMHECYNADTGEPLAPTAEQSPNGKFTGFVGWNLLEMNMLEGTMFNHWTMLSLDY